MGEKDCVNCKGKGWNMNFDTLGHPIEKQCNVCNGSGYVLEKLESEFKSIKELEEGCRVEIFNRYLSNLQGEKVHDVCGLTKIDGEENYLCDECKKEIKLLEKISKPITEFLKTLEEIELESPVRKEVGFLLNLNMKILGEDLFA